MIPKLPLKFTQKWLTIVNILKLDRNSPEWILRDSLCYKIIKKMRLEGIPSVEKDGEFKGLPTIYELKLISMLCTTICCKELSELISKL